VHYVDDVCRVRLPVELLHATITDQRGIQRGKVIAWTGAAAAAAAAAATASGGGIITIKSARECLLGAEFDSLAAVVIDITPLQKSC
jgi:hypothetical protein